MNLPGTKLFLSARRTESFARVVKIRRCKSSSSPPPPCSLGQLRRIWRQVWKNTESSDSPTSWDLRAPVAPKMISTHGMLHGKDAPCIFVRVFAHSTNFIKYHIQKHFLG